MIDKTCRACAKAFTVPNAREHTAIFCSRKCRATAEARPAQDRFFEKVDKTDTCWIWMAAKDTNGYGRFGIKGSKTVLAHVFAYTFVVGPVPEGLELDHLCRNPSCVNPAHLEAVTHRENVMRGDVASRETCRRGHQRTPDNVVKNGRYTTCLTCRREHQRSRREKGEAA